jgi:anti-sigma B factor antagonist
MPVPDVSCPGCETPLAPAFACPAEPRGDATWLLPDGELDVATAPELEAALDAALANGARRIVCDLRGLTFADSTGISRLVVAARRARRDGFTLELVLAREGAVARVVELMQIREGLPFVDPPEEEDS